ncbi:MAG: Holliday junction branch migration protein RuvA [Flavobacteriales bacterium]|nr:Holliday junction branch migration protein RuvA [Flavobacteriales bacterium]
MMIESLRGELIEKAPDHAVVECHGVGYLVHISANTFGDLPERGPCRLFIHYTVSVDVRSGSSEHRLSGFVNAEERHLFRQLIEVQGVSATIGMLILGAMRADQLRMAIMNGDEGALKRIKGIGPKLAQRILAEMSGRLANEPIQRLVASGGMGNTLKVEALSALVTLGLDRVKAERTLQGILNDRKADPPELEELIRLTLKNL